MTKLANQINCKWHNIVKFEIDKLMVRAIHNVLRNVGMDGPTLII